MKICRKCGIEKGAEFFRKDERNKNGLQARCYACENEYSRLRKTISATGVSGYMNEYHKKNNKNQRDKFLCRQKTAWLMRKGIIKKQPCTICGDLASEKHHKDYKEPIEITWLCKKHHMVLHKK